MFCESPKQLSQTNLARTDSAGPEWGRGSAVLKQPRSQAMLIACDASKPYTESEDVENTFCPKSLKHKRSTSSTGSRFSTAKWTVEPSLQGNGGLVNVVRAASEQGLLEEKIWVGSLGFPTEALSLQTMRDIEEKLNDEHEALAIFTTDTDFSGHYKHYCKKTLWPMLHYQIPTYPKSKAYEDNSWRYYAKVNEAFANKIAQNYKHGDTIWVHDYHLFLLPSLLRQRLPDARIGFFLHTAFPSSEVFRCLASRKQLLQGMLGANLVMFQTAEYASHFLQTCSRFLVVETTEQGVQLDDRFVNVGHAAIGIVPEQLNAARKDPAVAEWAKKIKEKYAGQYIIAARDKLEPTRGVKHKFLAYEKLLKDHPEWKGKVVLIQVGTPGGSSNDLDKDASAVASRIDRQYSTLTYQPLVLLEQDVEFLQYLGLLTAADVLLLSPLRDGMNLTCHEYIVCQSDNDSTNGIGNGHGPLILSEFTGSASIFGENAISINPWDHRSTANAIHKALELADDQPAKIERHNSLLEAVEQNNGLRWIQKLHFQLRAAYESQQDTRDIAAVPRLVFDDLSRMYRRSEKKLFILNYDHALMKASSSRTSELTNSCRVMDVLTALISANDQNIVYVTTEKCCDEIEHAFRRLPNIGLIAEQGCFLRPFSSEFRAAEWVELADSAAMSTSRETIKGMLDYYFQRIDCSSIEERQCSVIFHYNDAKTEAEAEAASRLAGEFANHLNEVSQALGIRAVPVDKAVVIEPRDHSKMTAAARVLEMEKFRNVSSSEEGDFLWMKRSPKKQHVAHGEGVQFLMVAGNDREDEAVFRWANELAAAENDGVADVVTVCVGKRNTTEAKASLTQGTTGLLTTLENLSRL